MPRSSQNPAVKVVEFFKRAELQEAVLVLALCGAEVQQRQRQSRPGQRNVEGLGTMVAGGDRILMAPATGAVKVVRSRASRKSHTPTAAVSSVE